MMILYHGSNVKIQQIDLSCSRPYKDFGRGFYLSPNEPQALRIAKQRTFMLGEGYPIVSRFAFDEQLLHNGNLNFLHFDDYSEPWAEFVIKNRSTEQQHSPHNYDVVYGPIANDGVTFQLRRYEAGLLTLAQLIDGLKYAKGITFQYLFATPLAISKLKLL